MHKIVLKMKTAKRKWVGALVYIEDKIQIYECEECGWQMYDSVWKYGDGCARECDDCEIDCNMFETCSDYCAHCGAKFEGESE